MDDRISILRNSSLSTIPEICTERARLVTESYQNYSNEPVILKRARTLEKILLHMTIFIEDEQLIAGNLAGKLKATPIFPEFSVDWIEQEMDGFEKREGDRFLISPGTKEELRNLFPYWKGKTHYDRCEALLNEETKKAEKTGVIDNVWIRQGGDGHIIPDFKKVIDKGLLTIIKEAEEQLSRLDLTDPKDLGKVPFLQGVIIANNAVIRFAHRYAELARAKADKERDFQRRQELWDIANNCLSVPANPARNFYEAVQSLWFIHLVVQIEDNGHSIGLGRVDQFLYPYFQKDFANLLITREQAVELISCFIVKCYGLSKIRSWHCTQYDRGYPTYQNLTLGGQTSDGLEAVNELSYICLDAFVKTKLPQPAFSCRWHKKSPWEWRKRVVEVVSMGLGGPAILNDETVAFALIGKGMTIEDALDYGICGCAEPTVMGKSGGRYGGSYFNQLKALEIALYGGKDPRTGYVLCPQEKSLIDFTSYEEVEDAYKKQVNYFMKKYSIMENSVDFSFEELIPNPFLSSLTSDCIKRGKHIKQGGAVYDYTGNETSGTANLANSLAAVKKLVFEEKVISGKELLYAMETNFEDTTTNPTGEGIRQLVMNKAPKFGNDDDYVDRIAVKMLDYWASLMSSYKNTRYDRGPIGCHFHPSTTTVTGNIAFGKVIGATPDGRKSGEPFADSSAPFHGTEIKGITSAIKSVSKLPFKKISCGGLLNMRINPLEVKDETQIPRFEALIRSYFDLGGFQIQWNVVSTKTLREAQIHPEKYKDLVVKVAGYSALFVTLDRKTQDDIILRTEHVLK
ncbi:MAG: glycyl radical protein [Candidatus Atribacteria bacterium]|nr:glycyl radical protein [Candidatus Atribacteria bacterium]